MYFVYVVQNPKGILYKGQTDDLQKRIQQHNENDNFPAYTKKRGPWALVYHEQCETREQAKIREKYLKSGRGREFLARYLKEK